MGKLNHEPQIHHFSHPHPLALFSPPNPSHLSQISAPPAPCSACKHPLPAGGSGSYIYACGPCNFSLHVSCTQFPQLITHPSHPHHPLTLLPTSTYPGGFFNCDACNRRGNGFSYHCSQCDFDLHVICASKPLSITNQFHPHPLILAFSSPYEMKGFSCDICRKIGTHQWLYRCNPCEFDVHLECATAKPTQPLQHHHSFPIISQQHQNQFQGSVAVQGVAAMPYGNQNHLIHSASTGGRLQNNYPVGGGGVAAMSYGNQNHLIHSASTGGRLQNNYPVVAPRYNAVASTNTTATAPQNDLTTTITNGIVDGAAQQVGQTLVQSLLGGGGGGGSGDSSSFLSSILGGD